MYNVALSKATGNKFKISKFLLQVATWAMRELHFSLSVLRLRIKLL